MKNKLITSPNIIFLTSFGGISFLNFSNYMYVFRLNLFGIVTILESLLNDMRFGLSFGS